MRPEARLAKRRRASQSSPRPLPPPLPAPNGPQTMCRRPPRLRTISRSGSPGGAGGGAHSAGPGWSRRPPWGRRNRSGGAGLAAGGRPICLAAVARVWEPYWKWPGTRGERQGAGGAGATLVLTQWTSRSSCVRARLMSRQLRSRALERPADCGARG